MSQIIATGSYLPSRRVTNDELIQQTSMDSSDEWISQRTGIQARHFAPDGEGVAEIAIQAAKNLFDRQPDLKAEEVRLIIVASMSQRGGTPSIASLIQEALGAKQATGFDINAACSGFVVALDTAAQLAKGYESGYTLVVGAEKMSQILDFSDRSSAILFGDGAGALLIQNDGQGLTGYQSQIMTQIDPDHSIEVIQKETTDHPVLTMNGRGVFRFVQKTVIPSLDAFLSQCPQVEYLLAHQANQRLLDLMKRKLKHQPQEIPSNIQQVGNVSAASIPLVLDDCIRSGKIQLNGTQDVVMVGFGAGLTWGQIYLKL